MKKIYAFFAAVLMSAALFATPENVPTVQDLAAKYDVANNVVLCCYFDSTACNPVVLAGSYNGWSDDPEKCVLFEALEGFDGWFVAEVKYEDGIQAKPLQLNDGSFDGWDYQAGDKGAWIYLGGKEADVQGGSYGGEANVTYPEAGAYIYEIAYWKNHNNPCKPIIKHKYSIYLLPPFCEKNDQYFVPAIAGKFNGWKFQALDMKDYEGKVAYGIVVEAAEGAEYKFTDKTFGYDNQYQWLKAEDESWQNWDNFKFPEATQDTTLVYDWSDNDSNRYAMCNADIYTVTIKALLPEGAPEAGVEIMGTFIESSNWEEPVLLEYDAEEEVYTATVKGIEASQFKFREAGTWDNEILYFDEEKWDVAPNFKFGEEWEFDKESLTATIELDLSDPAEYKWKVINEEVEYVVMRVNLPTENCPDAVELDVDEDHAWATEHLDNGWWFIELEATASQSFRFTSIDGSVVLEKYDAADNTWAALTNELVFGELWQEDTYKGVPCKMIDDYDISDPAMYRWAAAPEGIENIVLTEKAKKVVVDGAIYIVRDNKMFNIHGAQVR